VRNFFLAARSHQKEPIAASLGFVHFCKQLFQFLLSIWLRDLLFHGRQQILTILYGAMTPASFSMNTTTMTLLLTVFGAAFFSVSSR